MQHGSYEYERQHILHERAQHRLVRMRGAGVAVGRTQRPISLRVGGAAAQDTHTPEKQQGPLWSFRTIRCFSTPPMSMSM